MKRFLGFVKKEFFHIFRDIKTLMVLFGIPIAEILIFGYVITNEIKDVRIAILDQSKDEITSRITNKILSSGYFILQKNLLSIDDIEKSFRQGKVREVIIFEPGFAGKLQRDKSASIQLIADASDANTANLIVNYTSAIIQDYIRETNQDRVTPMQIMPQVRMLYNEEMKGVYMFIPGTMALILMLVSALMTSISITREKELGSMEVLLVSPMKPFQIILGKVTPYFILSFINVILIILLGYVVFKVPVQGNIALLFGVSMLYIMMALSIGIMISSLTSSQQSAMFISMLALMLPTMLLSGFIFPIENMPKILQWLSYIMPARWYVTAIKHIMLKGTGFMYIWKEIVILAGFTVIFISISVKKFKVRLE
jgi:ABC-2 type transport system permease protein